MRFSEEEVLKGIDYVFNILWPRMIQNRKYYKCCKNYSGVITTLMNDVENVNDLLKCLTNLNMIGETIATGLIYSMWRDKYIPFDKYTLEHCYRLRLIPNKNITDSYEKYCESILQYINNSNNLNSIEDLVRESTVF